MDTALKNTMDSFIHSYVERDKSIGFANWLSDRLKQEMPGMSKDMSDKLSGEIINGIEQYDKTLAELSKAVESGQSKEGWLADCVSEAYSNLSLDDAGEKLQKIYGDMSKANTMLMEGNESVSEDVTTADCVEAVDWNEYSLKDKALNIGKQAVMSGLGSAANIIRQNIENGEGIDSGVIGQALQDGLETSMGEVKAVVAGAMRSAAENKLADILPDDTPVEVICDMACVAVESADALFGAASGKNTITEALDKIGRASVASVSRWCAGLLKAKLLSIPIAGPIITMFAGGLLDHLKSSQFSENVYTVVHDVVYATWEGIKQTGRDILNTVTNITKMQLHN